MDFDKTLLSGKDAERLAMGYLKERHGAVQVFQIDGEYAEFDLIAVFSRGKIRTIEVKRDYREADTGNVAIEYRHNGKLSGIFLSSADWFIFILKDKLLCMKRRELCYFLKDNEFKEVPWNGDKSQLILVPSNELLASGICDVWDLKRNKPIEKASNELIAYA